MENMTAYPEAAEVRRIADEASHIVIIQADNPDADSLGSALALEQIFGELGKQTSLYCSVDMPGYLRYMEGWDRVSKDFPNKFDATVIVDASTMTLLEKFQDLNMRSTIASRPCIVLDHHAITDNPIPFATAVINDPNVASTGELIYRLAKEYGWQLDSRSGNYIMNSILGDTQGLTNDLAKADTYRLMAELIELGVSRPQLEEARREFGKMPPEIFKYKSELIRRTEIFGDGRIAFVAIPQQEINDYSPLYNPAPLIQNDMLQTSGIQVAIVLKHYDNGRITGAIRSSQGYTVAGDLAAHFGGGGHKYASGFKLTDGRPLEEVKSECVVTAGRLLDELRGVNEIL